MADDEQQVIGNVLMADLDLHVVNNLIINRLVARNETGLVSDGYHTFNELYTHRGILFLSLCAVLKNNPRYSIWRSNLHSGGDMFHNMFIVGITNVMTGEQVSYHFENEMKQSILINLIPEYMYAPPFDGHTSDDVLTRLTSWIFNDPATF